MPIIYGIMSGAISKFCAFDFYAPLRNYLNLEKCWWLLIVPVILLESLYFSQVAT